MRRFVLDLWQARISTSTALSFEIRYFVYKDYTIALNKSMDKLKLIIFMLNMFEIEND